MTRTETLRIGREFDDYALGRPIGASGMPATMPSKKACVIASVRNEGLGLLEWIAHYRVLGFDTLIIYSNGNTDGSDLLLEELARNGIVHLRWNDTGPDRSPQMKAYRYAFWRDEVVREHEWVAFLDADEFMMPLLPSGEIASIMEYCRYIGDTLGASAVELNWKWFGGSRDFDRHAGLCMHRFRLSFANPHVKTLFRLRDSRDIKNFHHPMLPPGAKTIDGSGAELPKPAAQTPPGYLLGQINHYWQKSFEEYYLRKTRGRGAFGPSGEQRSYASFFDWWNPGSPDPYPGEAHLVNVGDEMQRLAELPGIAAALTEVEMQVLALLAEAPDLRQTYAELLAARSTRGSIGS